MDALLPTSSDRLARLARPYNSVSLPETIQSNMLEEKPDAEQTLELK